MKAFSRQFRGTISRKASRNFCAYKEKIGSEGLSEAAAEVENVQHNGIILVFWGWGVIRFIAEIFAVYAQEWADLQVGQGRSPS